jgi:hypothetical protein|tara:strand:- start:2790 stop:4022 length:1233 start_codon:yes stop_codon:yes gene_type:complete
MRGREVKKILTNPMLYVAGLTALPMCAMEAISEREMSEVAGQAFITIDASSYSDGSGEWSGDYEFTKVNLGLDIETLLTVDTLKVGEFDRVVGEDGTVAATNADGIPITDASGNLVAHSADLIIENFGLGRVTDYQDAVNASVDEFKIRDPYIELAYKVESGVRKIAGVRIGFSEAQGWLSGDLISLTGNLNGYIEGPASVVYEGNCPGAGWLQCTELWAASLVGTQLVSSIDLVDGATGTEGYSYGAGAEYNDDGELQNPDSPYLNVPYLKRASWAGVPAGRSFTAPGGLLEGLIPSLTGSEDCMVTGTPSCFALTNFQSVYIGNESVDFENGGGATGVFVSLQTSSVPWENFSGLDGSARVLTQRGAFLNLAKFESNGQTAYPLNLDLFSATNGAPRVATCVGQLKGC